MVQPLTALAHQLAEQSVPFVRDAPEATAFYEAIGRVVVDWGHFEWLLDKHQQLMLRKVAKQYGTQREPQVSLKRKLQLVREIYESHACFKDEADGMNELLRDVLKCGDYRANLVHSYIQGWIPCDPPRLYLRLTKYKNDKEYIEDTFPTAEEIGGISDRIEVLYFRLFLRHYMPLVFEGHRSTAETARLRGLREAAQKSPKSE